MNYVRKSRTTRAPQPCLPPRPPGAHLELDLDLVHQPAFLLVSTETQGLHATAQVDNFFEDLVMFVGKLVESQEQRLSRLREEEE
ncbi:hypothetical protein E2C01_004531 [Portunus trituberculatus]|uniref:Uncharacterized protein n=1 Tax=Portunus trituberculatus TaxID=210409 RepID=A0A5B7CU84_PORTR|nr:hypothetical protein [Portunus trituberculatus]